MIQQADILTAIRRRWERDSTLTALVPGGLHHAENTGTRSPWAVFLCEDGDLEWFSGQVYLQRFLVEIGVYTTAGTVDAGAIGRVIDELFRPALAQHHFQLPGPNAKFIGIDPAPGALELLDETHEAKGVLALHRRYDVLIQAER